MTHHVLVSRKYRVSGKEEWWYSIPPLGNKYNRGDTIELRLRDFEPGRPGRFSFPLSGEWFEAVRKGATGQKRYTPMHIWSSGGGREASIQIGNSNQEYEIEISPWLI